jgi:hypothetical protein
MFPNPVYRTPVPPGDRWAPALAGAREALAAEEPDRFYEPPYGGVGWLGVRLDRDPDWDELVSIVEEAYRLVAPKRLIARLDADADAS